MGQHLRAFERPQLLLKRLHCAEGRRRSRMVARVWPTDFCRSTVVRVVDVTSSLAGPYCTEILGALGADVVKVEHPAARRRGARLGPPFWEGSSVMFYAANLNKRSVAPRSQARARGVCSVSSISADVFLQSLRPGTATRLGFGAEELRARNPRLVYCDIGAFGRAWTVARASGVRPAAAGVQRDRRASPGSRTRPGVRVGASIIDQGTGMWAALGDRRRAVTRAAGTRWTCRSSRRRWGSCPTRSLRTSPAAARPVAMGRPSR